MSVFLEWLTFGDYELMSAFTDSELVRVGGLKKIYNDEGDRKHLILY